jgi:hypothetical protein
MVAQLVDSLDDVVGSLGGVIHGKLSKTEATSWRKRRGASSDKNGLRTGFAQILHVPAASRGKEKRDFIAQLRERWGGHSFCAGLRDEERFLSPQADTFAGANVKKKASACSVRNDGVVWAERRGRRGRRISARGLQKA